MYRITYSVKSITTSANVLARGVLVNTASMYNVHVNNLANNDPQRRYFSIQKQNPILPLAVGCGVAGVCLVAKYVIERAENYKSKTDGKGDHTYAFANYYQGGFDKDMTKREAALILGVRINSDQKRIQKAYRTILLKNHPDKGGSPYLAAKVNQAKDILLGNQEAAK